MMEKINACVKSALPQSSDFNGPKPPQPSPLYVEGAEGKVYVMQCFQTLFGPDAASQYQNGQGLTDDMKKQLMTCVASHANSMQNAAGNAPSNPSTIAPGNYPANPPDNYQTYPYYKYPYNAPQPQTYPSPTPYQEPQTQTAPSGGNLFQTFSFFFKNL
jgi:hypothetical protein